MLIEPPRKPILSSTIPYNPLQYPDSLPYSKPEFKADLTTIDLGGFLRAIRKPVVLPRSIHVFIFFSCFFVFFILLTVIKCHLFKGMVSQALGKIYVCVCTTVCSNLVTAISRRGRILLRFAEILSIASIFQLEYLNNFYPLG